MNVKSKTCDSTFFDQLNNTLEETSGMKSFVTDAFKDIFISMNQYRGPVDWSMKINGLSLKVYH